MSAPCPTLAFVVTVRLDEHATDPETRRLVEDLFDLLDRNELTAAGRGERVREYLIRREGSQATDADRSLVRDWASRWAAIASVDVGEIVDVSDGD